MSTITTHVLDTSVGGPAEGVSIVLEKKDGSQYTELNKVVTNSDGRVDELLPSPLTTGVFRLTFQTAEYFKKKGTKSFYPEASIVFEIEDPSQHYHVPLLISGFGYSTYRGS
ncbi:MAG: hydroxyisourate hydrolase [Bacteriovoracaceae bacterium]|jgi:5-hydroxyisourate hydrolase|nr:hydroxyisourate hydrolase [Bacteriovoracaceae bacterium]